MAAGILTGEILAIANPQADLLASILTVCVAAFGSILPDIDHPNSLVSTSNRSAKAISGTVSAVTQHRGFTHTVWFIAIIVMLVKYFLSDKVPYSSMITAGLCAGMLSHMLLDTLNEKGIMWLWPIYRRHIHTACIRTGSKTEETFRNIISFLATGAMGYFMYVRIKGQLL